MGVSSRSNEPPNGATSKRNESIMEEETNSDAADISDSIRTPTISGSNTDPEDITLDYDDWRQGITYPTGGFAVKGFTAKPYSMERSLEQQAFLKGLFAALGACLVVASFVSVLAVAALFIIG